MSVECLRGLSLLIQQQEASGGGERNADAADVLAEIVVPALKNKADDVRTRESVEKRYTYASGMRCRRRVRYSPEVSRGTGLNLLPRRYVYAQTCICSSFRVPK